MKRGGHARDTARLPPPLEELSGGDRDATAAVGGAQTLTYAQAAEAAAHVASDGPAPAPTAAGDRSEDTTQRPTRLRPRKQPSSAEPILLVAPAAAGEPSSHPSAAPRPSAPPQGALPLNGTSSPSTRSLRPPPAGRAPSPARRRALPRRFQIGFGIGAALVAIVVLAGRSPGRQADPPRLEVQDDMIISEEDLHSRHEVEAHEFRPKDAHQPTTTDRASVTIQASEEVPAGPRVPRNAEDDELAERRARRSDDPEDLISRRGQARPANAASADGTGTKTDNRPLYLEPRAVVAESASGGGKGTGPPLVAAGQVVTAVLASPLELQGRTTTVVAVVNGDGPLPEGSRFIGVASASGDRVVMRFRTLSLPTGEEIRVSAQAQGEDGSFGAIADVSGGDPSEPSVERGVAVDTSVDVGTDLIGGGVLGRAAGDYARGTARRSRRLHSGSVRTLTVRAGAPLGVFIDQTIFKN